jgi:hypothetical protein
MESIASHSLADKGGWKAGLLTFSQPKGLVITTSSNSNTDPSSDVKVTVSVFISNFVMVVESLISAFSSAGLAMSARMFLYVPAQKRFSIQNQYRLSEF